MHISRELAIYVLKYCYENPQFYFPFTVVCKEYSDEDDDFVEVEYGEWEIIYDDLKYQTFQLWENLQNIDSVTLRLIVVGFIQRITGTSLQDLETEILLLEAEYRAFWRENLWESENSEEFALNEYIYGKAEGLEEVRLLIRKYREKFDNNNLVI